MLNKWKIAAIWLGILLMTLAMATNAGAKTRGNLHGDKVNYYKNQDYFVCEGNAQLEYKDYQITADFIQYYQKEEKAIFQGEVVIIQGKNKITGQKMTANLKKDEFVIEGGVYIYYLRKNKNQTDDQSAELEIVNESAESSVGTEDTVDKEEIVEIWAQHVVYISGDNDYLEATNSVTMEVNEDTIKADYLEYKGGEEIVFARDNVEVLGEDDERITCSEFSYRIDGDDEGFDANGQVELEFSIDDEEEETKSETAVENDIPVQSKEEDQTGTEDTSEN